MKINYFLTNKVNKLRRFFKGRNIKNKSFGALNYIIFKSFLKNKKESCTIKKARELSYKVLKFEKELADMILRGYAVMEFREEFREWLKKVLPQRVKSQFY